MENAGRLVYIPLIERIYRGKRYCSLNEWEAWRWLLRKMNTPIEKDNGVSFRRNIEESLEQSGAFSITVPINTSKNPERPWIVNEILKQKGATLLEYQIWQGRGKGSYVEKVTFTYTVIL